MANGWQLFTCTVRILNGMPFFFAQSFLVKKMPAGSKNQGMARCERDGSAQAEDDSKTVHA
jgi:hypothetical protein